jgi:8-oxo-dGTP diphosphatase
MHEGRRPFVGLGVIIIQDGKVLMGLRKGAHGAGTWGLVGGHLEWGESFESGARREVMEEVGLELGAVRFIAVTNDYFADHDSHYVTVHMAALCAHGHPLHRENAYIERWEWFPLDMLPSPLFHPLQHLLNSGFQLASVTNTLSC